jgi:hypothetical protein
VTSNSRYNERRLEGIVRQISHAITINERQMINRRPAAVTIPMSPSDELESVAKSITNTLHGAGLKKWEGIQRETEAIATRIMYIPSLNIEKGLH